MHPLNSIFQRLAAIARLASVAYRPYRREILLLTFLGFVSGLLEGIGINAVIPLLTFVLGIQNPSTDMLSGVIQQLFAFAHVPFVPRYLLGFIVILFVGKACVLLVLNYIQISITTNYERETRSRLFRGVLAASWPYLLRQKLGNLETALMVDTPASTGMLWKLSVGIMLATSLSIYLVIAFLISAPVTIATMALGVSIFLLSRPLMSRVHALSGDRAAAYSDTTHHIVEHLGGIKTVKAFGIEADAMAVGERLFDRVRDYTRRIQIFQQLSAQIVAPIGVMYIAALLAISLKTPFVSLAAMPAILYLIYRIFSYVQQIQVLIPVMSEITPHLQRIIAFQQKAERSAEVTSGSKPFSLTSALEFRDVRFSYEGGREVLEGVSFTAPKGRMLGIVGPSGAGKTTCVDLILRLLSPKSGSIALDGVDIQDIALDEWRKNIAYVSQDLFIIQGTIRENIAFYDDTLSDEDILEAAKKAHIDGFLVRSQDGLNTIVGERGVQLSAGERQRLVIARALARKPQLLILDEATSALDNESEAHIKKVIEELKGDLTIIAIAHRLTTIMDSDSLVVLDHGRVVETGAPDELLARKDSYFYKVSNITR